MKTFHIYCSLLVYYIYLVFYVISSPQQPEINDQFEKNENSTNIDEITVAKENTEAVEENEIVTPVNETENRRTDLVLIHETMTQRLCNIISGPIINVVSTPKVRSVLRNIGTCIVNGAMELVTYYFPAPLIPLIATAAGMVIPFEPVVMLREKMPVTSYRRAFRTALNSFLSTFDKYRLDDESEDPYMTRRFNRRLMNDPGEKVEEPTI